MAKRISEWVLNIKDNGAASRLSKIGSASNKANRSMEQGEKQSKRLSSSYGNLAGSLRSLVGAYLSFEAGKSILSLGMQAEQTQIQFEVMTKSASKARDMIKQLQQFANVTPFETAEVIKAGKSLTAFGVSADKLMPTLKNIGNISAGTGKDFNELALIYGKARIAGTLYAEDINQLVEAGVNIFPQFSKILGVQEGQIKKLASKGKISFSVLEQAFRNMTNAGGDFDGMMGRLSQSAGGVVSTVIGTFKLRLEQLGQAFNPLIVQLGQFSLKILNNTQLLTRLLKVVAVAVGLFAAYKAGVLLSVIAMKGLAIATGIATAATALFTGGFKALNVVMRANPIGLIITAIAALAAAFVWAWNKFEGFRKALGGIWGSFKAFFMNIKNLGVQVMGGLGELIVGALTFDLAKIKSGIKRIGGSFKDFGGQLAAGYRSGAADAADAKISFDRILGGGGGASQAAAAATSTASGSLTTPGGAATSKNAPTGVRAVSGGGKSIRNVTVNIESLVQGLTVQAGSLQEGAGEIREIIIEELVRAVSGGEQILSNG